MQTLNLLYLLLALAIGRTMVFRWTSEKGFVTPFRGAPMLESGARYGLEAVIFKGSQT